jgi:hypothetical protein
MKILRKFMIEDLFLIIENMRQEICLVQIKINKDIKRLDEVRLDYLMSDPIVLSEQEKTELTNAISDFALEYLTTQSPETLTNT